MCINVLIVMHPTALHYPLSEIIHSCQCKILLICTCYMCLRVLPNVCSESLHYCTYLLHAQLHTIIAVCVAIVAFLNQSNSLSVLSVYAAYLTSNFAVATYVLPVQYIITVASLVCIIPL